MPKQSTFPTLFDDVLQLQISKLKEWGYLNPEQHIRGTVNWSTNGNSVGSISIAINTSVNQPYIELDYKYRDEPRNYKVFLITKLSNLGKGELWFFVCPHTGKLCRKLYSIIGYFLHRDAFKGIMYESQIQSKKWRDMDKFYGSYFKAEKLYEQLYKKHLKKTYAGKPTKKYAKLIAELQKSESYTIDDIERMFIT
ncbi:hypothetical protein AMR72_02285 [Flavobacterium psychrophilum]|nr:hypothetical protein AMR72_02285 [Flavobacterium psychrophilum]AOE51452.1 hypothetical protein ALW18_02285 [Flavobacterium psychrophilum]